MDELIKEIEEQKKKAIQIVYGSFSSDTEMNRSSAKFASKLISKTFDEALRIFADHEAKRLASLPTEEERDKAKNLIHMAEAQLEASQDFGTEQDVEGCQKALDENWATLLSMIPTKPNNPQ